MSQWQAKAKATLWRYKGTGHYVVVGEPPYVMQATRLEITPKGKRCDWAIGTVYDQLGMVKHRE